MNKNYIIIGIVITLALIVIILTLSQTKMGSIRNIADTFVNGMVVGSSEGGGCIKMRNSGNTGWMYIYIDSTLGVVTESTSSPFSGACGGL